MNEQGHKAGYFLYSDEQPVLGFAGIYEWWRVGEGMNLAGIQDGWLCSMAIITRLATDALGHVHDRMPVIVPPSMVAEWLAVIWLTELGLRHFWGPFPIQVCPSQKGILTRDQRLEILACRPRLSQSSHENSPQNRVACFCEECYTGILNRTYVRFPMQCVEARWRQEIWWRYGPVSLVYPLVLSGRVTSTSSAATLYHG